MEMEIEQQPSLINKLISLSKASSSPSEMSGYENVVVGKLKLKGKPLDVKGGGVCKKKKKQKKDGGDQLYHQLNMSTELSTYHPEGNDGKESSLDTAKGQVSSKFPAHLTPAEKRYLEQWEKIDMKRIAKNASKSHRDKIQEFNQHLANLSEHYDIPKVGPG